MPMIPRGDATEVTPAASELIVIDDDGPRRLEGRVLNHRGSIIFLNEAKKGPVTVSIDGDFGKRADGDLRPGEQCITVQGIVFSPGKASTPTGIPTGATASSCILVSGTYDYVVQVGDRSFEGRFAVKPQAFFRNVTTATATESNRE